MDMYKIICACPPGDVEEGKRDEEGVEEIIKAVEVPKEHLTIVVIELAG
jgi:hypothetical protein